MTLMENFRDFHAGPDPFGCTWHVLFRYLQTAISIRNSDSIDVCFLLQSGPESGEQETMRKIVFIRHADMRAFAERSGRKVSDTWCSRIALSKIRHVIETAEDIEKEYLLVTPREIEQYDAAIQKWEAEWLKTHAA
jgi:hypothetical protein